MATARDGNPTPQGIEGAAVTQPPTPPRSPYIAASNRTNPASP